MVNVAPPAVHIEPAQINVHTPDVNVHMAEGMVHLDATVESPKVDVHQHDHTHHHHPRGLTRKVPTRDADGLVTEIVEQWVQEPLPDTTTEST